MLPLSPGSLHCLQPGTKTRARGGQESQSKPLPGPIWSHCGQLPSTMSIHGRSLPRWHGLDRRRIASINVLQQSKSPNCDFQRGRYRSPVSCLFLTSRWTLVWSGFPVSPALANAGTERDRQPGRPQVPDTWPFPGRSPGRLDVTRQGQAAQAGFRAVATQLATRAMAPIIDATGPNADPRSRPMDGGDGSGRGHRAGALRLLLGRRLRLLCGRTGKRGVERAEARRDGQRILHTWKPALAAGVSCC